MASKSPKKIDQTEEIPSFREPIEPDTPEEPEDITARELKEELKKKRQKVKAEVRASSLETKEFRAKKGDIVEIPADETKQSPAVKHALKSGNMVVLDLGPVKSEKAPEN